MTDKTNLKSWKELFSMSSKQLIEGLPEGLKTLVLYALSYKCENLEQLRYVLPCSDAALLASLHKIEEVEEYDRFQEHGYHFPGDDDDYGCYCDHHSIIGRCPDCGFDHGSCWDEFDAPYDDEPRTREEQEDAAWQEYRDWQDDFHDECHYEGYFDEDRIWAKHTYIPYEFSYEPRWYIPEAELSVEVAMHEEALDRARRYTEQLADKLFVIDDFQLYEDLFDEYIVPAPVFERSDSLRHKKRRRKSFVKAKSRRKLAVQCNADWPEEAIRMQEMPRGKFMKGHALGRFDAIDSLENKIIRDRHEKAAGTYALRDYHNLKVFGELDNQFRDEEDFLIAQIQYYLEGYWTEDEFLRYALPDERVAYQWYDSRLKKLRSMRKDARYALGATG